MINCVLYRCDSGVILFESLFYSSPKQAPGIKK